MKKKQELTIITMTQLRAFGPCYDPSKYLPETFQGTVIDLLKHKEIPPQDKLWAVCREEFLSASLLRRFAVAQAKTCRKSVKDKKEFDRILRVCSRFANGKATNEELSAARYAAESAAWYAARSAAWSVVRSAARSDARSAAWSAAWYAARSAARSDARSAAWSAAVKMLLKMVRAEYRKPTASFKVGGEQ